MIIGNNKFNFTAGLVLLILASCSKEDDLKPSGTGNHHFFSGDYDVNTYFYFGESVNSLSSLVEMEDGLEEQPDLFLLKSSSLRITDIKKSPFYSKEAAYQSAGFCLLNKTEDQDIDSDLFSYFSNKDDTLYFHGSWANNGSSERWHYGFPVPRIIYWNKMQVGENFTRNDSSYYLDVSGSGWHYISSVIDYSVIETPSNIKIGQEENKVKYLLKLKIKSLDINDLFGNQMREEEIWFGLDKNFSGPLIELRFGLNGRLLRLIDYNLSSQ